ncbi:HAD domain-containing protein [Cupriavidus pauculus]|uniref:HAD domain-containing protein n=1 Tax=Cupriavidus pauculus TaxID=82633 RepID=UPI001FD4CC3F|nr:HAD domain-containing protein [Cupriavidus pauculus]
MADETTLYLAFDGVLHPNVVTFREGCAPRLRAGGHKLFENMHILEQLVEAHSVSIVLHNWWVPLIGYRSTLSLLPESIRQRVVGATWRQPRGPRARLAKRGSRRDWLQADLLRRCPKHPVLLDCEARQVVPMLDGQACIVDDWKGIAESAGVESLQALLGQIAEVQTSERPRVNSLRREVKTGILSKSQRYPDTFVRGYISEEQSAV